MSARFQIPKTPSAGGRQPCKTVSGAVVSLLPVARALRLNRQENFKILIRKGFTMLHPLNFPLTQPDDPPSKRVAAARREINYRLFYLRHALRVIEKRLNDRERGRHHVDVDEKGVNECLGLMALHGGAVFRQLAEVRRLVVYQSNKQGQPPTPPCGGAGVCPENTSQDLGDNRDE